ncbi:MAG TPA: alpha/beta fold hydrolase [Blastocatellia bacterium]|nr:alpha/beta fold hydrolase [Blastocatellia bacterium]
MLRFPVLLIPCVLLSSHLTVHPVRAQGDSLTPPDNLIVEGIPKIPASLADTTKLFRNTFSDSILGWSPLKEEVVALRQTYTSWPVMSVPSPGGNPGVVCYVPGRTRRAYYAPNGKYLVFSVDDASGAELSQLYRQDIGSSQRVLLTDGKSKNLYPIWSNSGEWLAYSSNRRNGKDLDVYIVNPNDPKTDRMVAQLSGEDWAVFDWSPDDRQLILSDFRTGNESYLWVLDLRTGAKRLVTPAGETETVFNGSFAQFSADGKGIYHATDRSSEFQRLAYLDLKSGRYTYLTKNINWDVEESILSPDRSRLAFTINEDGVSRLHVLNTASGKEEQVPQIPIGVISKLTWHKNGNLLGFSYSSATAPGDIYSVDLTNRKLTRWTRSVAGVRNAEELRDPELIRWKSFDGRTISGFLYSPPARHTGSRPVLIDIHGGPRIQFRPSFDEQDSSLILDQGIAIIYPNIRGSSGYGKTFHLLDNGVLRADCTRDIGALLDWIKTRPELDSTRVAVRGFSYGGYVALSTATTYGSRIRGAISISAASNLRTLMETTDKWNQDRWRREYGDERDPKTSRFMEATAPLNHVATLTVPLLLVHGEKDSRIPASESRQLVAAVKKRGTPLWLLLARDEGHAFTSSRTRDFMFFSQVLFLREFLIGTNSVGR